MPRVLSWFEPWFVRIVLAVLAALPITARTADAAETQTLHHEAVLAAAQTLGLQARLADREGDLPAAERLWHEVLALQESEIPGSAEVARTLRTLGYLALWRGDIAAAQERLNRSEAILRPISTETLDYAGTLNDLALVAQDLGDLEQAETLQRRALTLYEQLAPESPSQGGFLMNFAVTLIRRGELAEAEDFLRRSVPLLDKPGVDPRRAMGPSMNLGMLALRRGDLATAESFFHLSLERLLQAGFESLELANIYEDLALVARKQERLAEARSWEEKGLAVRERLDPEGFWRAQALQSQARIEVESGRDLAAAERLLRQAEAMILEVAPDSAPASTIRRDLGKLLVRTGRPAEAEALYLQILSSLERRGLTGLTEVAEIHNLLGHAQHRRGDAVAAVESFCRASRILDQQRPRLGGNLESRGWFESATQPYSFDCLSALVERGRPAEAFHALERGKTRAFLELLAERDRLAGLQAPQPLDLAGARRALDPGTVLLAYAVGPEQAELFVVQPEEEAGTGLEVHRLPIGRMALREEVDAWRRLLAQPGSDLEALQARAARLYDLLLKPAEERLGRAQRILISGDGPLHLLPWAALRRREQYLAQWRPIHLTASAAVYGETRRSRRPAGDPGSWHLVAFGDPRYPAASGEDTFSDSEVRSALRRRAGLEPLPATRGEVLEIAALFPGAEVHLGEEATEEQAKRAAPRADLLHIAGHGLIDERFPLDSALALTIPTRLTEGRENGLLQAWEIFETVRLDAHLVTLSACDTALGKEQGGEGLLGLTRAFQLAGAHSVLSSLWSVSDDSTARLMKRFYNHLRQGRTKDEALRAAQLDLLSSEKLETSHPYHWAGFALHGDWK